MKNTIGNTIKKHCHDNHIPITSLATKLKYHRSSMHKLLTKPDMSINTLMAVSQALNHNFFQYLWVDKTIPTKEEILAMRNEISQLKTQVSQLSHENSLLQKLVSYSR